MKEGTGKRGVDTMEQCDLGLIFARVTALMSTRVIKLNVMLKYELAAVPTSMRKVVISGFPRQCPSSSENTRWKLPIPQLVSETLWLLVDVPYSTPCAPMAKHILHQGYCIELRQVCPQHYA